MCFHTVLSLTLLNTWMCKFSPDLFDRQCKYLLPNDKVNCLRWTWLDLVWNNFQLVNMICLLFLLRFSKLYYELKQTNLMKVKVQCQTPLISTEIIEIEKKNISHFEFNSVSWKKIIFISKWFVLYVSATTITNWLLLTNNVHMTNAVHRVWLCVSQPDG